MSADTIIILLWVVLIGTFLGYAFISGALLDRKYNRIIRLLASPRYTYLPESRFVPNTNARNIPAIYPYRHKVYTYGNGNFVIFGTDRGSHDWETDYCFFHRKIAANNEISLIVSNSSYFSEKLFRKERNIEGLKNTITYYRSYASPIHEKLEDLLFGILGELLKTEINRRFDFEIFKGNEVTLIFDKFPETAIDVEVREAIFDKLVATVQAYGT